MKHANSRSRTISPLQLAGDLIEAHAAVCHKCQKAGSFDKAKLKCKRLQELDREFEVLLAKEPCRE